MQIHGHPQKTITSNVSGMWQLYFKYKYYCSNILMSCCTAIKPRRLQLKMFNGKRFFVEYNTTAFNKSTNQWKNCNIRNNSRDISCYIYIYII